MAKLKDTDYLFLSTRIRVLERSLLTKERMERMLDASAPADAAKILQECGYPEMEEVSVDSVNAMLSQARARTFDDLSFFAPDHRIVEAFQVKYDYHNAKVLLKSEARGVDGAQLLVDTGRIPAPQLQECVRASDFRGLPGRLSQAIVTARETLGAAGDPQLCDFVLDRAYFEDMLDLAQQSGSGFLEGYVRLNIDVANLKSLVRTLRMGKDADFLRGVLFSGGSVETSRILATVNAGTSIIDLYAYSPLNSAAELGAAAVSGAPLTQFEKRCDDAVMDYISSAKYVAFGEAPVAAYLAAKENEFTAVRIIMTGRLADLSADVIRERLRECYV